MIVAAPNSKSIKTDVEIVLTFFAKRAVVVEVAAFAHGASVRVDADAAVLAGILLDAHVELADTDSLLTS